MILVLALITATLNPAQPKVGDRITVTFAGPVTLDASAEYEVVERLGPRVVVRTFEPKPFTLSGTVGGTRFSGLRVPVTSVLAANDSLTPAPLVPPRPLPYPLTPWIALAMAAIVATAVWVLLWKRSRVQASERPAAPLLGPEERYRRAVAALRANPSREARWAALASETRAFLAATRPALGSDLTTAELLPRLRLEEGIVREILRLGDLEKFSLRGAPPRDFDEVAANALALTARQSEEVAA